jgi:hypothetical protein
MATNEYIVAVRREQRNETPTDWVQQIGAIDGVSVVGSTGKRAQVAADAAGIAQLRQDFGSRILIEPVIAHRIQGGGVAPSSS